MRPYRITESTNDPEHRPAYEIFARPEHVPTPETIVHIYTREHVSWEQLDQLRKHLKRWAKGCGFEELKEREE